MKTVAQARTELESYLHLEAGWDEDGSIPPDQTHVQLLQKFLDGLPEGFQAPHPMVSRTGKVGMYLYDRPFFLDVEIEPDGQFSVLIRIGTYRDQNQRWYPGVSVAEFVALYTAYVSYWIFPLPGEKDEACL